MKIMAMVIRMRMMVMEIRMMLMEIMMMVIQKTERPIFPPSFLRV